jgi:hypothetical protein
VAGRQIERELMQQEFLVRIGLGVAGQSQGAAIGCRKVDIEHLDGGHLVEEGVRCQAGASGLRRARSVTRRQ